jgi:hypothetical protein
VGLIRQAIESIGGKPGNALAALLDLASGTRGQPLSARRHAAAKIFGLDIVTFYRGGHEGRLLSDLAVEMHRRCNPPDDSQPPIPIARV